MNDLAIFYLMTSATYVLPVLFITFSFFYADPIPYLRGLMANLPRMNRLLRNIGITRLEQFFQLFNLSFDRFLLLASGLQVTSVVLVAMGLNYDVPFLPIWNLNERLPSGTMYVLFKFWITTSVIHSIPLVVALWVTPYINLPMSSPLQSPAPSITEITRWENLSQDFALIRLTRFETLDQIYMYARCYNENLTTVFNVALCQGRGVNARTECYLYTNDDQTLQQVIPSSISINELEEIFNNSED